MPYKFVPDSFHTGVTAEAHENQRFRTKAVTLIQNSGTIIFARLLRPMNALQLCRWQFSHKETLQQTFFKWSPIFCGNRLFCIFETPSGNLGATYDDHLRLVGKRIVDFLLALIELLSLGGMAEALRAIISSKSAILLERGPVDPKFQVEGVAPINHSSSQKTRLNDISYGIKIWTDLSSVLSQFTRVTDRRTDRQTEFSSLDRVCIPCRVVKININNSDCTPHSITFTSVQNHLTIIQYRR